jgi:hypothetical protein
MYPIVVVRSPLPDRPNEHSDVLKVAQGRFELWPGSSAGLF